jgi:hypothetical protein
MRCKVYDKQIRLLTQAESAIISNARIASPRYRRFRYRHRDGTFIATPQLQEGE